MIRTLDSPAIAGNGGTARMSAQGVTVKNVALTSVEQIVAFASAETVDLVVVGPEVPLAEGLAGACVLSPPVLCKHICIMMYTRVATAS